MFKKVLLASAIMSSIAFAGPVLAGGSDHSNSHNRTGFCPGRGNECNVDQSTAVDQSTTTVIRDNTFNHNTYNNNSTHRTTYDNSTNATGITGGSFGGAGGSSTIESGAITNDFSGALSGNTVTGGSSTIESGAVRNNINNSSSATGGTSSSTSAGGSATSYGGSNTLIIGGSSYGDQEGEGFGGSTLSPTSTSNSSATGGTGGTGGSATIAEGAVSNTLTGGSATASVSEGAVSNSVNSAGGEGGTATAAGGVGVAGDVLASGAIVINNGLTEEQARDLGSAPDDNSVNVTVEDNSHYEAQKRNPVNTAWAAPLVAAEDACMGSTSAGGQGITFGLSFATTWKDKDCVLRKDARFLYNARRPDIALSLMCSKDSVLEAVKRAGTYEEKVACGLIEESGEGSTSRRRNGQGG